MRRIALVVVVGLVSSVLSIGAAQAHGGCHGTNHRHTRSGACKDTADAKERDPAKQARPWDLHCGANGRVFQPGQGQMALYFNQDAEGFEAEACSDSGAGNQQGRLIVQGSTANQGARVILDSDPDQAFAPGYIIVQAAPTKPGVWCTENEGAKSVGDGYSAPWSNPGPDGGLGPEARNCIPEQ